jgi:pilus assembly protein CpaE
MDAMHLGVREFLPLPVNREKLLASIERIADADGLAPAARILHFIPASGGCGCTTLACNVAASLARHAKTLLLDLDLTRGNAATAFDLRPRYSISDLMDSSAPLDKALLDTALAFHPPTGLAILARPEFPEEAQRVTPQGLARLLGAAGRLFDYIVIDSTLNADPLHCLALREAHVNLLVMQLNVPSAKNAERFLACLRRLGINGEKIKVVVNRFNKRGPDIEPEEVERALGVKISWRVPNDFKTALAATNLGQPLLLRSPRAELSESIAGLSHLLNGKKELVNAE